MNRIKRYSYVIVLAVSIVVMTPLMMREIWRTHTASGQTQNKKELNQSLKLETPEYDKLLGKQEPKPTQAASAEEHVNSDAVTESPLPSEPAKKEFEPSDASYFDDALFIGDSRTVGICEYGDLKNATYYADTGMSVSDLYKKPAAIPGGKDFETVLTEKTYGKVYIMLGINEVGNDRATTMEKYVQLITHVKEKQPETIVYIQANLHVTQKRSQKDSLVNNANIDSFNESLSSLADEKTVFYIDVNDIFDDDQGNLKAECTSDGTHVLAKYYQEWTQWLCSKTIRK